MAVFHRSATADTGMLLGQVTSYRIVPRIAVVVCDEVHEERPDCYRPTVSFSNRNSDLFKLQGRIGALQSRWRSLRQAHGD